MDITKTDTEKPNILLVEDEKSWVDILNSELSDLEFSVAATGYEPSACRLLTAMRDLLKWVFETGGGVVLTDYNLDDRDWNTDSTLPATENVASRNTLTTEPLIELCKILGQKVAIISGSLGIEERLIPLQRRLMLWGLGNTRVDSFDKSEILEESDKQASFLELAISRVEEPQSQPGYSRVSLVKLTELEQLEEMVGFVLALFIHSRKEVYPNLHNLYMEHDGKKVEHVMSYLDNLQHLRNIIGSHEYRNLLHLAYDMFEELTYPKYAIR